MVSCVCCAAPVSKADEAITTPPLDGDGDDLLLSAPSLFIISDRIESRASALTHTDSFFGDVINGVFESVESGASNLTTSFQDLSEYVSTQSSHAVDFLSSLVSNTDANVSVPTDNIVVGEEPDSVAVSHPEGDGVEHVDYKKYLLKGYVDLPSFLKPILDLPILDHYLIVGLPTMAPSSGLAGYRDVVPKAKRAAAPFLIVIDSPGRLKEWKDEKYIWAEFPLGDVFRLDVSGMKAMEEYVATLTKKAKWNFKDRQKKFNNKKVMAHELIPLPTVATTTGKDKEVGEGEGEEVTNQVDEVFVMETLWPLYKQTGEKNGFTVLTEEEFRSFHVEVPNLQVMMCWDVREKNDRKLVSFCTGVRWKDVLMPMWCGTDYENELNRTCSTYFNMLYEYIRVGIEDPGINWVDLGASRRTAKTAIGFHPYPSSGYFRCKNSVMHALVESMMENYYKPERLINDP